MKTPIEACEPNCIIYAPVPPPCHAFGEYPIPIPVEVPCIFGLPSIITEPNEPVEDDEPLIFALAEINYTVVPVTATLFVVKTTAEVSDATSFITRPPLPPCIYI